MTHVQHSSHYTALLVISFASRHRQRRKRNTTRTGHKHAYTEKAIGERSSSKTIIDIKMAIWKSRPTTVLRA